MSLKHDSEDAAIEQPTIVLFAELGWETVNAYGETFAPYGGPPATLGRESREQVLLLPRLRAALHRLNPGASPNAIETALDELAQSRRAMSREKANQSVYALLKDGIRVPVNEPGEDERIETIRLMDWNEATNNDFLLASQFWVSGDFGKKRMDLVGFVNGIPLVLMELKASHQKLELAFEKNLSDYKDTVPQLFWYNALLIVSNGSKSRVGSMTAGWEHFAEWKKVDDENEPAGISLETMIRGTCEKQKLLDLVENFTIFDESASGTSKLVAKNHQFLGVNNAIRAVERVQENQGKLGVFWHTQGSGKSYSMVFFSQKVLRKMPGNWTFVIVTDREDLDGQIYRNFANTGAVSEPEDRVRARNTMHLRDLLNKENHRYVFTLIQKFRTEFGERHPLLSERKDIIVMTDEAHRSQYDVFAANMRAALPNAAFIGFTGTPLMAGEEKTREVFGDYVSIYNFKDSVDDQNTVPLFYENRIPELQLTNDQLSEDMASIIEDANLDQDQEWKLQKEFAREYHLITREDRLDRVGEDIVTHYMGRGIRAKAMVISVDKMTTLRTYDAVQRHWTRGLERLREQIAAAEDEDHKAELEDRLRYLEATDMAVIVSQSQNEIEEFKKKGLDIAKHRKRMVSEDLETKFKKSDDPLRIVFVCAMWITGFDVPSCATIYLDKPMKDHTLMQTIARANRVFKDKPNGLIVDYIGVMRNLERALAMYGNPRVGGGEAMPGGDKEELVRALRGAVGEAVEFCTLRGIDVKAIEAARGFDREKLKDDAVAVLVANDDVRRQYLAMAARVRTLYKSLMPDRADEELGPTCKVFQVLADKIRAELPAVDISGVMADVEELLNRSIATDGYVMPPMSKDRLINLSAIDFDLLREKFAKGRKTVEVQKLRNEVAKKLGQMVKLNPTRIDYVEEFERMIEEYNSGAANVQLFFDKLTAFVMKLKDEDRRAIAERLTEEELVIFDLLTRPQVGLSEEEELAVKKVAKSLLETLKRERLVLDWRKQQTTRAGVRYAIEIELDKLPRAYTKELYEAKCDAIYEHVYEAYLGPGKSLYEGLVS